MKKAILFLLSLALVLVLIFVNCHPDKEHPEQAGWPGYQAFPSGYNYMDTTRLQRALSNVYLDTIRQHAWSLFAGIMQPADNNVGWPIWYTWPNSVDAMLIKQIYGLGLEGARNSSKSTLSLIQRSKLNTPTELDTLHTPFYPIPQPVLDSFSSKGVFSGNNIIPGKHFLSNGDILIPTESISLDGYNWIQANRYYDSSVMMGLYRTHVPNLNAPPTYIVTKHMYWPVLASQPLSAIPVWDETYFNPLYAGYAGYEKWTRLVAVDPTNTKGGQAASVSYLHGVYTFDTTQLIGPMTDANAVVHNISDFYSHKVTKADWDSFDANDKAILNASSYWAYNKPFGVGDYLVTIAMHINTKELPSWTMQSVWWTDHPNTGIYSQNKPKLPQAQGPWTHYDLVQAYGVPSLAGMLPKGTNPYIELVIHPMLTNCNNCHMRAGYPQAGGTDSTNWASYQNPTCKNLLEKLYPNTPCLTHYTRTDFQWIISDYTHAVPPTQKK